MIRKASGRPSDRTGIWSRRPRGERGGRSRGHARLLIEPLESRSLLTGTWTALAHGAPSSLGTMELLSDGTVMVQGGGVSKSWYGLTPDANGSYVNGTWSSRASMSLERLYTATNVLKDGRIFELGGEYSGSSGANNWTNTGEIYDPVKDSWSSIPNFPQSQFGDDPSMVLPDGRVMAGYLSGAQTYIYDPVSNSWSAGATKLRGDSSDEETWVKLPDDSVLSYEVFTQGSTTAHAQRYVPSSNTWVDAGTVPNLLSSSSVGWELGPGVLLPDGRVFYVGATGHTAFYTPSTNAWAAGPDLPGGLAADDAPGAMMPDGKVLLAADSPLFNGPTRLFEFDPSTNAYTDVTPAGPNLSGTSAYVTRMLMLPSGQVLFGYGSSQLYVYTPSGAPKASWQPTISGIASNGSNYTLTGTQINGISAGASYGDDAEMDTNYPIIELKNTAGNVYFARTFNWSSTGVATGSTPVTTDFTLPSGIPGGTYSMYVIANGIASAPYSFTVPGGTSTTTSADLAVSETGPATATEGDKTLTYSFTVTNNGPDAATSATLTETLGAYLKFVSATGSNTQSGGVVTFSLGTLSSGQSVTVTVTAQALEDGKITNSSSVSSGVNDPSLANNSASVTTTVAEAPITVSAPITLNTRKLNNYAVATFTHAQGIEPTSAFTATIAWGDGTTSTGSVKLSGSTYTVSGSHNYRKNGNYTITTTVVESETPKNAHGRTPGLAAPGNSQPPSLPGEAQEHDAPSSPTGASDVAGSYAIPVLDGGAAGSANLFGHDLVGVSSFLGAQGKKKSAMPEGPGALFRF